MMTQSKMEPSRRNMMRSQIELCKGNSESKVSWIFIFNVEDN